MPAAFPTSVKTYVTLVDNVDLAEASQPNSYQEEITAIETELGINTKGPNASVRERLERVGVVKRTNKSGAQRVKGDVVIQNTANTGAFTTTTTEAALSPIQVVGETIADNAEGHVQDMGDCAEVKVNGAVAIGDTLVTHTTATRAKSSGGASLVAGAFAVALSANASGDGTVRALLFGFTFPSTAQRPANLIKNGSFEQYTGSAPDNWSKDANMSVTQASDGQFGDKSAELTVAGITGTHRLYQELTISSTQNAYFRGKKVTLWVRYKVVTGASEEFRIAIDDGVGETQSAPLTSSSWATASVTRTIDASATVLRVELQQILDSGGVPVVRVDGVMLVLGDVATEFAPHHEDPDAFA